MKVMLIDTETTGLSAYKNGIHQLAGIIKIDGKVEEKFNYKIRPFPKDEIDEEALKVSGVTKEQIMAYPEPTSVHMVFTKMMEKYVDKFKKEDKFHLAGQNVPFDAGFLNSFFRKCGDKYYGSWFNWDHIDLRYLAAVLRFAGFLPVENLKLETLAKHFKLEFNGKAHDAMADIEMTDEILKLLINNYLKNPGAVPAEKKVVKK